MNFGHLESVQKDGTGSIAVHTTQQIQNGDLTGAERADNDAELTFFHRKGNTAHSIAILLAYGAALDLLNPIKPIMRFAKAIVSAPLR